MNANPYNINVMFIKKSRRTRVIKKVAVAAHDFLINGLALALVAGVIFVFVAGVIKGGRGVLGSVVVQPKTAAFAAPAIAKNSFGMAFGNTLPSLSQKSLDAQLQDISNLGFTWLRTDIDWSTVQLQNAQTYDWSDYDRVIASANAHHLQVLGTIAYAPKWARSSQCPDTFGCAPASTSAYATFAKAVVQRYAPKGVKSWEIWNEPNTPGFWSPTPSPAAYTALLKAAYTAVKSADPTAKVITAGLSPAADQAPDIAPRTFLTGMYAVGAQGYFDAVGYHPYSYPAPPNVAYPWSGWSQMADLDISIRSIMVAHGDGDKNVWATEFGAPTNGPDVRATLGDFRYNLSSSDVDEQLQSAMAEQFVAEGNSYPWAGPFFWYSYQDLGTSTDTNENFFGIRRADGSAKPVYATFKRLLGQ